MEESPCEDFEDLRATIRPKSKTPTDASSEIPALPSQEPESSQAEDVDYSEDDFLYGVDAMKDLFSSLELRISQQVLDICADQEEEKNEAEQQDGAEDSVKRLQEAFPGLETELIRSTLAQVEPGPDAVERAAGILLGGAELNADLDEESEEVYEAGMNIRRSQQLQQVNDAMDVMSIDNSDLPDDEWDRTVPLNRSLNSILDNVIRHAASYEYPAADHLQIDNIEALIDASQRFMDPIQSTIDPFQGLVQFSTDEREAHRGYQKHYQRAFNPKKPTLIERIFGRAALPNPEIPADKLYKELPYDPTAQRAYLGLSMANVDLSVHYSHIHCILHPALAERFEKRWRSFQLKYGKDSREAQPKLAYHGTSIPAFDNIVNQGLVIPGLFNGVKKANGSAYGRGVYCSPQIGTAQSYCRGRMLILAVLPGKVTHTGFLERFTHDSRASGDIWVMYRPSQVLPLYVAY